MDCYYYEYTLFSIVCLIPRYQQNTKYNIVEKYGANSTAQTSGGKKI
jgi:hypothetical protein